MIGSPRAVMAGALLASLAVAAPARAGAPCAEGETLVQTSRWDVDPVRETRIAAVPGRFLLTWRGEGAATAVLENGGVVGRGISALSEMRTTTLASGDDGHLMVGIDQSDRILMQRLSWDGARLGVVEELGLGQYRSGVGAAWSGESYVVAWSEQTPRAGYTVRAAIVETSGEVHEAVEIAQSAGTISLDVVVTGEVTWVVWSGSPSSDRGVFGARLARDGSVLGEPVQISKGSHVVTTASTDQEALVAIMGLGTGELVRLGADGVIGEPVDMRDVHDDIAGLTRAPGRDGYVLWTARPLYIEAFPSTPAEVTGLALAPDGTLRGEPPFALMRGTAPVFASDGDELRYAYVEDSAEDRTSRLRTGTISADGVVDPGIVIATEPAELVVESQCLPPYQPPPAGSWQGAPSDDFDDCGGCEIAPGATRTALILVGVLAAILPRRRRGRAREPRKGDGSTAS